MPFGLKKLEFEDIKKCTDNFSEERFISKFNFGRIFLGRDGDQEFIVKVWDNRKGGGSYEMPRELILVNKFKFVGVPKFIHFCDDNNHPYAVTIDIKLMNTVHNLIPRDDFSWVNRIKVALGFALCLRSFHKHFFGHVIRNVDAAHIICDQEYTPTLYDFGFCGGGHSWERWLTDGLSGSPGYTDPYFLKTGECSEQADIYAYGIVLLGLITKRQVNVESDMDTDSSVNEWAEEEYILMKMEKGIKKPSLVDQYLKKHPYFNKWDGCKITELAIRCIRYLPNERPEIDEVVKTLQNLTVVRMYGDENGLKKVLVEN